MSTFGEELIQSLGEALAHTKGEGPAIVHSPVAPREVREQARLSGRRLEVQCRVPPERFAADRSLTVSSRSLRAETRPSGVQAPNPATVRAMKELDEGRGQRFDRAEELFRDLEI